MAFFNTKQTRYIPQPIPDVPPYVPPSPPTPPSAGEGSVPDIPRPIHSGNATLTLYYNNSDNNVLDKALTTVASVDNIAWNTATSVIEPVIETESSIDLSSCNYAYINTLNRYYYISNIVLVEGGFYQLHLKVDVLQTYKDSIRSCTGVIKRNKNLGNLYVNDSEFKLEARTQSKTIAFSNTPFTKAPAFLLTVSGGD